MIATPELIESLVAGAQPVRRLRPPVLRAMLWLAFAAAVVALLGASHGLRPDFAERLRQPSFILGVGASLATGVLAAVAAFIASLPDRSRRWLLLPVPTAALWISTIGYGCLTGWVSLEEGGGLRLGEALQCFATVFLVSVPLSLAMLLMLRHLALLRSPAVTMTASLAVATLTASALALFHSLDATLMILLWNVGVAALIVAAGALFGDRLFGWVAPR